MKILNQQYQKYIHLPQNLIAKHFPNDTVDQIATPTTFHTTSQSPQ